MLIDSHSKDYAENAQLVQIADEILEGAKPLILVGLLANYEKFELQNQYRVQFASFTDDAAMQSIVESMGLTCTVLRDRYVSVLDDSPVAWSIGGTLSYVGLGALAGARPTTPILSEDEQKLLFAEQ